MKKLLGCGGCLVLIALLCVGGGFGFLSMSFLSALGGITSSQTQSSATCTAASGPAVTVKEGTLPTSFEDLNANQVRIAAVIMKTGQEMGMGERGQLIALMTAMQESTMGENTASTGPGDAGIFQQRTLPGWYGTVEQVNDPAYGARIFFEGRTVTEDVPGAAGPVGYHIPGLKDIKNWESMPLTQAAQSVQRSAFPDAYAKHEAPMRRLMAALGDVSGVEVSVTNGAQTQCGTADSSQADTAVVPGDVNAAGFRHPTSPGTRVSSPFGWRVHPVYGTRKFHQGIDYANACGTPVYAVKDGTVTFVRWSGGAGRKIKIDHGGQVETDYLHLQRFDVSEGQQVKQGQQIGLVGTTGTSTGCHLHFGIKINGNFEDPDNYIER